MTAVPDTMLEIDGLLIPLRSAVGFTEDWSQVGDIEFRHTWNGRAHVLAPSYKRKYQITLSASGPGVWRMPALDIVQAGAELTLHSCKWQTSVIPVAANQCVLSRDFVAGSVSVRVPETDAIVAHTALSRTISLAAETEIPLAVLWRAKMVCLVGAISGSGDGAGGPGGWSMELVEKDAPA